jgi:hypothetical protein
MRILFLCLLVAACARPNATYLLPEVYTYPEERHVQMAVPVEPVQIEQLISP